MSRRRWALAIVGLGLTLTANLVGRPAGFAWVLSVAGLVCCTISMSGSVSRGVRAALALIGMVLALAWLTTQAGAA